MLFLYFCSLRTYVLIMFVFFTNVIQDHVKNNDEEPSYIVNSTVSSMKHSVTKTNAKNL